MNYLKRLQELYNKYERLFVPGTSTTIIMFVAINQLQNEIQKEIERATK